MIFLADKENIDSLAEIAAPYIGQALRKGKSQMLPSEVVEAIKRGIMSLFFIETGGDIAGCLVTMVSKKTLTVVSLYGEGMSIWLGEVIDFLRGLAKDSGCNMVVCHGRSGWERELKKYGWNRMYITMGMEV